MRNNLIFGGIDSSDFGVWISGSDTYSAAERDSEHFSVPGRNGDLIVDNGRYKNKLVTYPAFFPNNFPDKMENFKSAICRKIGYQRLEDSYHPDEYRMAEFVNGINPDNLTAFNRAGDFTLAFNCKPQRFLKSGDEPIQFIPPAVTATAMTSSYIPVNGDLTYTVHAPSGVEVGVRIETYTSNGNISTVSTEYCYNGDSLTKTFAATDAYFRIFIIDVNDFDSVALLVNTITLIDGEAFPINAIFARSWKIQNPTGYQTAPLIESFRDNLPYMEITNIVNGESVDNYSFHTNQTTATHFWMDCDMQHLYDDEHNNLTNYLFLTNAKTLAGKGLVFPQLGTDEINLYMYYSGTTIDQGVGLIQIYPRWWKI